MSYAGDCAGGRRSPGEEATKSKSRRLRTRVINHQKRKEKRERALYRVFCKVLLLAANLPHPDLSFTLPTQLSCETSNLPHWSLPDRRIVEHFGQGHWPVQCFSQGHKERREFTQREIQCGQMIVGCRECETLKSRHRFLSK